ncbi:MAG: diacylglycerol kinase family lipid kinase [Roseiflexaceae bacterium]|nr:diacylglycerol kinase family lipid kinase [Roseiflexaceae bacterium]
MHDPITLTTASASALIDTNEALPQDPRALIVLNPFAGQAAALRQNIEAARTVWQAHGWTVDIETTHQAGDGIRLAREAAWRGYDVVAAAGGDGTINEVINGLAGTRTALAALPVGTVNVWVRELGLPLEPRAAAEALLLARRRRIDLGRAGDRYFLLMAGIGFDAAVVNEVRSDEKRRLGALAYVVRAFDLALRYRGRWARIALDGRVIRGRVLLVVIGNSQLYGGVFKITPRACINDGLLDVCIIKGDSLAEAPLRLLSILRQRYNLDPRIEYHRARIIHITTRGALPVQVDGDQSGFTPMTFTVAPGALYALLPDTLPDDLLRAAPTYQRPCGIA